MKWSLPLSVGGLIGSFAAVCAMLLGVSRLDFLLVSLFVVSISSFFALIVEDHDQDFVHFGMRLRSRGYNRHLTLHALCRFGFGASLAAALVCCLTQAAMKISSVLSITFTTAMIMSAALFTGYVALMFILLSFAETKRLTS
ncbi:MAG: hypothetical protein KDD70_17930 [Bdellovibrionales bacterium]|nr:hypothetical protein [Bdellovibrionales bacterium]